MKLNIQRETLLTPLLYVIGAVEKRQTKPILANLLLRGERTGITLSATDLEIEIVAYLNEIPEEIGAVTLPARKLLDICRNLPERAEIELSEIDNKILIKSERSRFACVYPFPCLEIAGPVQLLLVILGVSPLVDQQLDGYRCDQYTPHLENPIPSFKCHKGMKLCNIVGPPGLEPGTKVVSGCVQVIVPIGVVAKTFSEKF